MRGPYSFERYEERAVAVADGMMDKFIAGFDWLARKVEDRWVESMRRHLEKR